jgi:glycine cleavage system regulatory protein
VTTLVLTVVGEDRPGLVSELSAVLRAAGASWERSEMARLAGQFAGMVEVTLPASSVSALEPGIEQLRAGGLHVVMVDSSVTERGELGQLRLELVGTDRPGIVAEISALLARLGVSIEELSTGVREAPMGGGLLFEARALLVVPPRTGSEDVRRALEALADELVVDLSLEG